ncbi:MAG: ankyrin repeat domain-containing protein, partial [Proteobacteria bacterium]|nr:ankyrin repeat domain-containing protein [Pseudomonadota bacterium]
MGMGHGKAGASTENELHQYLASHRGDLKEVKSLIEEKQFDPLQKEGQFGGNVLHHSARCGQLRVLRYFIEERGCSPASQDNRAMTPLYYAAYGKHLDIVHYLVAEQQMDPLCCAD